MFRTAVSLSLLLGLRGVVQFMLQVTMASRLGAGLETDAYFIVTGLVLTLAENIMGVLTFAVLPQLVRLRVEEGHDAHLGLAAATMNWGTALLLGLAVLLWVGAPRVIRLTAPGFSEAGVELGVQLLELGAVTFVAYGISSSLGVILQSRDRFISTAAASTMPAATALGALILLPGTWGIRGVMLGLTAGAVGAAVVQVAACRRVGFVWPRALAFSHPRLGDARSAVLPVAVAYGCSFLVLVMQRMWASMLGDASVSALGYATQIVGVPITVLVTPLGIVALPRIAALVGQGRLAPAGPMFAQVLGLVMVLTVVMGAVVAFLAEPIVNVLLKRGNFGSSDVALTASALRYFAAGLFAVAGSSLLGRVFCAAGRVRTFAGVWMLTLTVLLLVDAAMLPLLSVGGLAAAVSLAYAVQLLVLGTTVYRELNGRATDVLRVGGRLVVYGVACGVASRLAYRLVHPWGPTPALAVGVGAAALVAIVLGVVLRGPELSAIAPIRPGR